MARNLLRRQPLVDSKLVIIGAMVILLLWLGSAFALDSKQIFLPGETSIGHVLFEVSCQSCHEGFKAVSNDTCNRCHEAEMAQDVHGAKKFRDPRWAELREEIDVLTCTACHREHEHMFARGVNLPPDLCMSCHQGVIEGELASHNNFTADGCWTAGCHNFHDHRSIATGFLRQNLDQPWILPDPKLPEIVVTNELDQAPEPDLGQEFLGGQT
ncbi:MAG: cytochrome c3 family protein [Cyanobacteria bacterium J06621_8]